MAANKRQYGENKDILFFGAKSKLSEEHKAGTRN